MPRYAPHLVSGEDPASVHQALAATLDACVKEIADIHHRARVDGDESRPAWPMLTLRTPKGWTCPPVVDGSRLRAPSALIGCRRLLRAPTMITARH